MENNPNLFEIFENIFSDSPKPSKSICLQIDVLENKDISQTQLSDIFEILLHMFIYGFKKLRMGFTEESLSLLKQYFESVGVKFIIDIKQFDPILFKEPCYMVRYCKVESLIEDEDPIFIENYNKFTRTKLSDYIAVYQDEYESLIFISFELL